ncbi:DUF3592 domain-containing protein [Kiloniella sp. b19]|uniref:DUF3592 domain-containing protein n=1 Tax=Kiloniella sp. GXU_MW_B19 TaxID=3141326 RepID=UPI0031DDCC58
MKKSFDLPRLVRFAATLFFAFGFGWAIHTWSYLDDALRADGEVVDIVAIENTAKDSDKQRQTLYFPVVRFMTRDGRAINFQAGTGSQSPIHSAGDPVTILYNPEAPEDARLDDFASLWGPALAMAAMGAFALFLSHLLQKRRDRKQTLS